MPGIHGRVLVLPVVQTSHASVLTVFLGSLLPLLQVSYGVCGTEIDNDRTEWLERLERLRHQGYVGGGGHRPT